MLNLIAQTNQTGILSWSVAEWITLITAVSALVVSLRNSAEGRALKERQNRQSRRSELVEEFQRYQALHAAPPSTPVVVKIEPPTGSSTP